jgi:primary-amine oxidase
MRSGLLLGFGLPALLLIVAGAVGQQRNTVAHQDDTPPPELKETKHIEQSFPSEGPMETAWKIDWDTASGYGLFIKSAWFKRSPDHDWMQVLGDARLSEIFVPYHRGSPRFWDVSYNFSLTRMTQKDAGKYGRLHESSPVGRRETGPCVVEELKDRGVVYKSANAVRRGEVLLLWACLEAANYRYIMEYGFQDDGSITFRLGSTGHNYSGSENDPHLHTALWRIDINLDGPEYNSAFLMERIEPPDEKQRLQAKAIHSRFHNGTAGGADWDPSKFTMLRVINTKKKNARGEFYAYDLCPSRVGNARNLGDHEECTQHDFWVTRANPKQLNFREVKNYCKDEPSIEDTDIVLWYSNPAFHEPRTEDGLTTEGKINGCTHVAWSTFTLRPSNIFDGTPLFAYKQKDTEKPKVDNTKKQ